ncbi:hypothetical protein BH11VER1_BH11VER1_09530 [soil metagenome]
MNRLTLFFEVGKRDYSSLLGDFTIRVDDHVLGGSYHAHSFPLVLPTTSPFTLLIDDRACEEGCCPGLWVTARRSEDAIIWSDFRSNGPQADDPPPETIFIFTIDDYRMQIESAKADLQKIEDLQRCPPFEELMEGLHQRLQSMNYPLPINWLMADDLIRRYANVWINCLEITEDTETAKEHYEMLRKSNYSIEITLARHPCFDRSLALLVGRCISDRPLLDLRLVRDIPIGLPVHSPLKWEYLRWRFGINRQQPGLQDYKLPCRSR